MPPPVVASTLVNVAPLSLDLESVPAWAPVKDLLRQIPFRTRARSSTVVFVDGAAVTGGRQELAAQHQCGHDGKSNGGPHQPIVPFEGGSLYPWASFAWARSARAMSSRFSRT